ncbi:MAG: DMT family transporter, partial [Chlamydiota bacterium]
LMKVLLPEERFEKGIMYMVISSFMLSLFTLFGKLGTGTTSYFFFAFLRFIIPLALLMPYLLWKYSFKEMFQTKSLTMQFLRTGCMLVYQYSLFYYMLRSSLLDATVLQTTSPLVIPLLERIFFKHQISMRAIISIAVSFVGVLCILHPDKEMFSQFSLIGLLAPLGNAGSQVLYGHQARSENQGVNLFYLFFLCSFFSGAFYIASYWMFPSETYVGTFSLVASINLLALGAATLLNQ